MFSLVAIVFLLLFNITTSFPEQGIWKFNIDQTNNFVVVSKVAYNHSQLHIKVNCEPSVEIPINVSISYDVWMLPCYERGLQFDSKEGLNEMRAFHENPDDFNLQLMPKKSAFLYFKSPSYVYLCGGHNVITLDSVTADFLNHTPLILSTPTMSPAKDTGQTVEMKSTSQKDTSETKNVIKEDDDKVKVKREAAAGSDKEKSKDQQEVLTSTTSRASTTAKKPGSDTPATHSTDEPQVTLPADGVYVVSVLVKPVEISDTFSATVEIKIRGDNGYLSALDWPLLPFYGVMCAVYVMYGLVWLVVSACQWRDLLRIQFWIGGVLFLGMLEMAVFYAEYQSINSTGKSVKGAVISAEVVSCLKRTLARMVVIIVSLGFGIVKPRLGSLLHRVVGVGTLYFILSVTEGVMRVYGIRNDPYRQFWVATIFLAVLDSFICWWIFTSLVQTTRTLRLRRNVVKLSLYRHFTNTLIFAVIASVAFMVWSLKAHQRDMCIEDWKELWVDEAYWRFLFSVILLVIMILWRPTNNNQRYAFTPLLDAADDEDEEQTVPESFEGMKMRGMKNQNHHSPKGVEDDLKWIDENIPSGLSEVALPSLLDSDEEIMTTKFEISKMN